MKTRLLFISLFLLYQFSFSQNLVPNPSFEDTIACPYGLGQIDRAKGWQAFRWSPDYFNTYCNYNIIGNQQPRTGVGFAGFLTYEKGRPLVQEQLGIVLDSTLKVGTKYYLTFYVSCAYDGKAVSIATNKIGAFTTTYQYHDSAGQIPVINYAKVYSDSVINDSVNWTKISGSFVADSAYKYLIIGQFFDNVHIDTVNLPSSANYLSYYFIDDVCLSSDSMACNNIAEGIKEIEKSTIVTLSPNPATTLLTITTNTQTPSEIIIYDIASRKLMEEKFIKEVSLNIAHLAKGVYLYQVTDERGVVTRGKMIKE